MPTTWPFRARRLTGYAAPAPPFTPILPWQCWPVSAGPDIPTVAPYRDADIYEDVIARLEATGCFSKVTAFEEGDPPAGASDPWTVTLIPGDSEDLDWADPIVIERKVTFLLHIEVAQQDARLRWREMDRLANVARNALNGQSLADITYPGQTLVRRSTNGRPKHPRRRLTLICECVYMIDGFDGYNTDD